MKNVIVDFESYYDKTTSVVELGNPNYFKATDAYILAITVGDEILCGTLKELGPTCEQMAKDPTLQFWAANSNFDQGWWEKYWPATVYPWQCLLDLGAFHQFPRYLAGLSKAVLGLDMDKTTRDKMKGVHYEELPPAEQEAVQQYCLTDVLRSAEILAACPPMTGFEARVAASTRAMNRRGVFINLELVDQDKTRLERMRFEAYKGIPWHADAAPLSYPQLVKWCNSKGIPVPKSTAKTSEECSDLMSEHPELNQVLGTMRRFRRANTMLAKLEALKLRVTDDSIMPLDLLYCGAPHTRRWSSKGFNVQNLDKEPLDVGNGETVWTRNWIVPRPGKKFLILDYAQIEPRCLNWLAGSETMLAAMRAGYSIYEAFAIQAEGWKGKPGTIKKELDKKKYTLLKNRVLGLGYGMGAPKFEDYVRSTGGEVTAAEAKRIVDDFRKRNPKIVSLWRKLDNLITNAARDRSKHLSIEMPTGDSLQYFAVRGTGKTGYEGYVVKGDFSQQSKQGRLWGGTLTENVTQRMARDVMADAVLRLEAAGLPVAFTVHDEVIMEVDDDASAPEAKKEAEHIMSQAPEWAEGLPLGVEGDFADAYTK